MNLFYDLPRELICKIYEYDSTYYSNATLWQEIKYGYLTLKITRERCAKMIFHLTNAKELIFEHCQSELLSGQFGLFFTNDDNDRADGFIIPSYEASDYIDYEKICSFRVKNEKISLFFHSEFWKNVKECWLENEYTDFF